MPDPSPAPAATALPLDRAVHIDVQPGGEIVLRGAYHSTYDASIVDAATTTWPPENPGGASVDAGGLYDLEAGGFHMTSRDPATHVVHAVAKSEPGAACAALGVASPCLPLRVEQQAHRRLLSVNQWVGYLKGGGGQVTLEVLNPPLYVPPPVAVPYLAIAGGVLALGLGGMLGGRWWRKRSGSPAGQLDALLRRVERKLEGADAVLAAPLAPALQTVRKSLRRGHVDAGSAEGKRVREVLLRVEANLDASAHEVRSAAEQEAADELVREMESALEAADEARVKPVQRV